MGLNVENLYTFNGPFTNVNGLLRQSGVYLVSILENGMHKVLDIGESDDVHARVKVHDRTNQWLANNGGNQLHVSSYYCDEPTRMAIERQLRNIFNPVCGDR